MRITENKTIALIQSEFKAMFPGLKIEFYSKPHGSSEGSKAEDQLDPVLKISEVRTEHTEGEIAIDPEMTVADLEQALLKKYGLSAQIFRRSADLWLQTSATDHWTLAVQNRKGVHSADFAS